jgi:hypoxanthine phosphoribosyltransferase
MSAAGLPAEPRLDAVPGAVYLTREQIAQRVAELGAAISADYRGREPVLLTVLKGATIFLADLSRQLSVPHVLDFMAISSYRGASRGSRIRLLKDLDRPIRGRDVLIIEDVVDTGFTLNYLLQTLRFRAPASLAVCTLLDRPTLRLADIEPAYVGFPAPASYVVGYGFDYRQHYRSLPDIHLLERLRDGRGPQIQDQSGVE